jgi:SAM-dependent methyltransferase
MINYFDAPDAAALYAKGRPFYHQGVLQQVAEYLFWEKPLESALDVACGTGLSTRALLPYAREIIGIDASPSMLAHAFQNPKISYRRAPAEQLPLREASVDLLTLCEAFHWFDQKSFLDEVRRVLKPRAIFLVYGGGIRGIMDEDARFESWFRTVHLPRYPQPARNASFSAEQGPPDGFELLLVGQHEKSVPMTAVQLADFFLTVSNTLQYLKERGETPEEHHRFLMRELVPFYPDQHAVGNETTETQVVRHIRYGGLYYLMRKL